MNYVPSAMVLESLVTERGFSATVIFENQDVQGISLPPVTPKIYSAALSSSPQILF